MASLYLLLLLCSFFLQANGKVHHLFVGNLVSPASIHAFEFNDEAVTLRKTETIKADTSHPWIAFDYEKKNVYGATVNGSRISSYSVLNNSMLLFENAINGTGDCSGKSSAFVLPSPDGTVYSASWPGPNACGEAIAVYPNGTLKQTAATWSYANESGIHGLASRDSLLYSADLSGDSIWTHRIAGSGTIQEVHRFKMSKNGTHPRHLVAHPHGKYLYAVMEAANELRVYSLDSETGAPNKEVVAYSTIPHGANNSAYWSCEVALSPSKRYLWATTRAQVNTNNTGYISNFALNDDGSVKEKLFLVPTTTRGGIANTVTVAPFSDEWIAMTDFSIGYLQIWRMVRDPAGFGHVTLQAVARVDVADGGCCANAIWYD